MKSFAPMTLSIVRTTSGNRRRVGSVHPGVKRLIDDFVPTIIADESPDTSNVELLVVYPAEAQRLCVDIPFSVKVKSNLMVARHEDGSLCPYVDDLRGEILGAQIAHAAAGKPDSRILMFCGTQHLYSFPAKLFSFVHRLAFRKYLTSCIDLRKETWWDDSWISGWSDPDPRPVCVPRACRVSLGMDHKNCGLQLRYRSCGRRLQALAEKNRRAENVTQ